MTFHAISHQGEIVVAGWANPDDLDAARRAGHRIVDDAFVAKDLAKDLTCLDPDCDAALHFVNGATDGSRRGHWSHAPGTAANCRSASGPEGTWHRFVKLDLLGRAFKHEATLHTGGRIARADVLVRRVNNAKFTCIEIQHSNISADLVHERHAKHLAAGAQSTLWILDGAALGIETERDASISDGSRLAEVHRGQWMLPIRTAWMADLITECMSETRHKCTVAVLIPQTNQLRVIDRVTLRSVGIKGRREAWVTGWGAVADESTLREWAAGPDRVKDPEAYRRLDAIATCAIKQQLHWFDVAQKGDRVRVGFTQHHNSMEGYLTLEAGMWRTECTENCDQPGEHVYHYVGDATHGHVQQTIGSEFGVHIECAETSLRSAA